MIPELELWGQYALWIGAIAGGIAGIRYIYKWLKESGTWISDAIEERQRKKKILLEITAPETEWPNGSKTLVDSHNNLYAAVKEVKDGQVVIRGDIIEVKEGIHHLQQMAVTSQNRDEKQDEEGGVN